MRKRKAPGKDGLEIEILQAMDSGMFHQLFRILQAAWFEKEPQEFKDAYIINLPKKVDKREELQHCDNWRGINLLLSVAGKCLRRS